MGQFAAGILSQRWSGGSLVQTEMWNSKGSAVYDDNTSSLTLDFQVSCAVRL